MARVPCRLSIKLIYSLAYIAFAFADLDSYTATFTAAKVISVDEKLPHNADYKLIVFEVRGRNIRKGLQIKTTNTTSDRQCSGAVAYNISENFTYEFISAGYALTVPQNVHGKLYLCVSNNKTDLNQGENVFIDVPPSVWQQRPRRELGEDIRLDGIRVERAHKEMELDENGVPELLAGADHTIRLFGRNFIKDMTVTFTTEEGHPGDLCQIPIAKGFPIVNGSLEADTLLLNIKLPPLTPEQDAFFLCIKEGNTTSNKSFIHQGATHWLKLRTYQNMLPVPVSITIIVVCLMFSALFSGLNLGLMSMDRTELKILCNTGTSRERKYANAIQPVRNHGNYLLCSILLGNVFVNSIFTILLDGLTSGLFAVVFSTIAIVLFGEITPQAICSRHGLAIGAKTIYITKVVMFITFPLSYPVSKVLDFILGEEIGNVYNRERLKELVKVTTGENDLDKDEVNIISGALELRKKTVADVMTKIEDVFMLDYEAILDFETVSEIMKSGYSRVPVYESNRQNIVTMLYIKDLAFVDPDDNTPLKTLCQFYQNPCNFVFEDVTLDVMFRIFKEGNKGHMAFVHRVNNEGEGDPFYETIGLITLEDVIEELIQAEIMDETDVFTDNRTKRRRNAERRQDFSMFAERRTEGNKIRISPQLTLAAFQFLSTAVEHFLPSVISETIVKRLLKQEIIFHIKKNKEWRTDPTNVIYQQGKNCDYFVLILEGRVEVTVGKENLLFEGGPFSYFGTQSLVQSIGVAESPSIPTSTIGSLDSLNLDAMLRHTFQPDYTVRACTEVIYLRIKRNLYLAAKRATLMERSQRGDTQTNEQFDEEVDKLLHSLDEDDGESGHRTPRKRSTASKNANNQNDGGTNMSRNTSPKTPSLYSNMSPPHRIRDINGSIKSSPVDDIGILKDEEMSLLPKKS